MEFLLQNLYGILLLTVYSALENSGGRKLWPMMHNSPKIFPHINFIKAMKTYRQIC